MSSRSYEMTGNFMDRLKMFDWKSDFSNSNKNTICLEMALYRQMLKLHRKFILPKPFLPTVQEHHIFVFYMGSLFKFYSSIAWRKLVETNLYTNSHLVFKYFEIFIRYSSHLSTCSNHLRRLEYCYNTRVVFISEYFSCLKQSVNCCHSSHPKLIIYRSTTFNAKRVLITLDLYNWIHDKLRSVFCLF